MKVMGVDPGLDGAIATWDGKNLQIADVHKVPAKTKGNEINVPKFIADVRELSEDCDCCYYERPGARPQQAMGSAAKNSETAGVIRGVASVFISRVERVTPSQWKKKMKLNTDKEYSRARAIEAFPQYHQLFARKKDHDRAEAALLALYGYQIEITFSGTVPNKRKRKRLSDRRD